MLRNQPLIRPDHGGAQRYEHEGSRFPPLRKATLPCSIGFREGTKKFTRA